MLLSRIVLGVGSGVFVVTSYVTAANLEPVGRQAGAMSNVSMGFSASLVLGVPIGRFVAASYDWKVIFWGIGYSIPHLTFAWVAIYIFRVKLSRHPVTRPLDNRGLDVRTDAEF
ncbi:MFS transporter [Brevibacillus choshinensis]|uniref:MFS transporter n=1 Tax=Brevibacillus choshinensis TaxID=54911 RepID=UPI002E1CBBD3|nr:MFS transporter [Brevibacillus choshinensis]MED4754966.1 MFS transporter [Brevibacillus choshinensis]